MANDPANRVVDSAELIRAQIEHVNRAARLVHGEEHGVQAVLHVEIGLALLAVAQHVQLTRMIE